MLKPSQNSHPLFLTSLYSMLQSGIDRAELDRPSVARMAKGCDLSGSKKAKPAEHESTDEDQINLKLPRRTDRNKEAPWHVDLTRLSDSSATGCQGAKPCIHQKCPGIASTMSVELQKELIKDLKKILTKLENGMPAQDDSKPPATLREFKPSPRPLGANHRCLQESTDADKKSRQNLSPLRSEEYVKVLLPSCVPELSRVKRRLL